MFNSATFNSINYNSVLSSARRIVVQYISQPTILTTMLDYDYASSMSEITTIAPNIDVTALAQTPQTLPEQSNSETVVFL